MKLRICSGKNGGVGCGCKRSLRVGAGEDRRLAGQFIQIRSQPAFRAEEAHAVGARGIERDEDDVGMLASRGSCLRRRESESRSQSKKQRNKQRTTSSMARELHIPSGPFFEMCRPKKPLSHDSIRL